MGFGIGSSIVWNNSNGQITGTLNSTTAVNYSDIQGGWVGSGTGNIAADPLFTSAPSGDYALTPGSPCIDAANNNAVPAGTKADLDGDPRFRDDPATPDTGLGYPPVIDVGCFEFQPPPNPCLWDCASPPDGQVNVSDLLAVIYNWGIAGGPTDMNEDGIVNMQDLLQVIQHWGPCP